MRNRKIIYSVVAALLVLAVILGGIILYLRNNHEVSVVFLDVGQGDAILISEGSRQVLVDGGRSGKILLQKLGERIPFWDRSIEMIVATHPDQDHIGGLVDVFQAYNVKTVMKTNDTSETQVFASFQKAIENENAEVVEAVVGNRINFSDNIFLETLYPFDSVESGSEKDSNENSIVLKLKAFGSVFLLTGDLPSSGEQKLIDNKAGIEADVLKAGHHGSKYSTSDNFLNAVKSKEAVISAGANNTYGHPHPEVLARLARGKIIVRRTDEIGDIQYYCSKNINSCVFR